MRWLIAIVALSLASPAFGQTRPRRAEEEGAQAQRAQQAQEQYDRGVVAYNLERFDEAIAAFTRAYELDPAPILLFNIAQARWKKGENERALFYYRRYLEADPQAANRAQVEARMRELEAAPAPAAAASHPAAPAGPARLDPPAPPAAPPAFVQATPEESAPPPVPVYRRPWFWGAIGAGAVVAGGIVFFSLRDRSAAGCSADHCRLGMVTVPGS